MPSEKQIMRLKNVLAQRLKITKNVSSVLILLPPLFQIYFIWEYHRKMVDFPTSRRSIRSARIKLHGSAN